MQYFLFILQLYQYYKQFYNTTIFDKILQTITSCYINLHNHTLTNIILQHTTQTYSIQHILTHNDTYQPSHVTFRQITT